LRSRDHVRKHTGGKYRKIGKNSLDRVSLHNCKGKWTLKGNYPEKLQNTDFNPFVSKMIPEVSFDEAILEPRYFTVGVAVTDPPTNGIWCKFLCRPHRDHTIVSLAVPLRSRRSLFDRCGLDDPKPLDHCDTSLHTADTKAPSGMCLSSRYCESESRPVRTGLKT
jgi:hypothetical protein